MKVRVEIESYAKESNKPILLWLFERYHTEPRWQFVAACRFEKYGRLSYEYRRIWSPTDEGRALYYQPLLKAALIRVIEEGTDERVDTGIGLMTADSEAVKAANALLAVLP